MDEGYCLCAARHIENNPVKAKLCPKPEAYAYSSARAHQSGDAEVLDNTMPLLELVGDWKVFLSVQDDEGENRLRQHERTGRPAEDAAFIRTLELKLQRKLKPGKAGRPKKKIVLCPQISQFYASLCAYRVVIIGEAVFQQLAAFSQGAFLVDALFENSNFFSGQLEPFDLK
ncbi:hypothetical protein [Desulfovibrio sp. Huiquan2017]|uniref:hypothetical protein n=1 Tax=Desulfovibrio sp. Huiquan2017 TaxID=2816861 RepID=UPI001A92046A|nr:hypothetical protein [Desulfovibrio sp. Huiquan2017]